MTAASLSPSLLRQFAEALPSSSQLHVAEEHRLERDACQQSFAHFLPYWRFVNRETGAICSFTELWEGQREFVERMRSDPWLFALKAGKLGFTELECAYDAWVARFTHANARVGLFSKDQKASRSLLQYVRFGLQRLPAWMGVDLVGPHASDTLDQISFSPVNDADDVRTIVSYPATGTIAIDQSLSHAHIDELSHVLDPEGLWNSVATTVAPGGTCHVVTRGAGEDIYTARLWHEAVSGASRLKPFFAPYTRRPGRDRGWYEEQGATLSLTGVRHFAPETAEDALAGDEGTEYIPLGLWDSLIVPDLPELVPGSREAVVLGVDAAVTRDSFAVVAVTRDPRPGRHNEPAIRAVKVWHPRDLASGRIDYEACERFIRYLCRGGCPAFHPRSMPLSDCQWCQEGDFTVPGFNVVQITYDPYQLEDMSQRLTREYIAWMEEFDQGRERLEADGLLFTLAMSGRLSHTGNAELRASVAGARAKLSKDEDSKLRIVKRSADRSIDAIVAASMAVKRCLDLNL